VEGQAYFDGNKRTGMEAAVDFLEINGIDTSPLPELAANEAMIRAGLGTICDFAPLTVSLMDVNRPLPRWRLRRDPTALGEDRRASWNACTRPKADLTRQRSPSGESRD